MLQKGMVEVVGFMNALLVLLTRIFGGKLLIWRINP